MNSAASPLCPVPSSLARDEFVRCFGGVYENSPWVAERLWSQGIDDSHDDVAGLAAAMAAVVDAAAREDRLTLIRAHPDLAGRAAVRGELTVASSDEQASAGIDQCSPTEFEQFQLLNDQYRQRFGFPFVMAVRGGERRRILAAFAERVQNSHDEEFERAIREIHKIARMRLETMALPDAY